MVTTSNGAVLQRMVQSHFTERLGHRHTKAPSYFITRKYYVNKSSRDVQKMVVLLNGKSYKFYPVLVRLFNYSPVNSALWHCSNMTNSLCVD